MKISKPRTALRAVLLLTLSGLAMADEAPLQPSIRFTTGLSGQQTQLTWEAIPGAHYRIRSSTTLAETWRDRAVVVAEGTDGSWMDPEPSGVRAFYKIDLPQPEVFSVSPAVIANGSTLIIKAQCLPAGCSIVFDFGGVPPVSVSALLEPDGPGQYRVISLNGLPPGEPIIRGRIVDALGATVVLIGQTFEVTPSGFASDSPPSKPVAAAAVTKKMHGAPKIGEATAVFRALPGEVCLQECDLSVAVPAGPPLDLVWTYRSLEHGGSGTGQSHWEHCYDVHIEPIPAGSGVNATHVRVCTGDGRRDVMTRQDDGTFTADGMFRSGVFNPDTSFELTFADHSKFIFCQLVGAPWTGRLGSIVDQNGVALTCAYSVAGKLISVSSQFGQALTFDYDPSGNPVSVTDQTGRYVSYSYYAMGEPGGNPGDLKSVSCPQLPGQAAIQGPTTYTYSTGFADARRNGQLLTVHDGAGRLRCTYTYSSSANDTDADFARCVSMDCHSVLPTDAPMIFSYALLPPGPGFAGGLRCTSNDEVGRVMECYYDKHWRCVRTAELTGFATPGVPVTGTTNRPPSASKLRSSDPDEYVTACAYNVDHCCTVSTGPDGLKTITTYARDLTWNCPVLERGNARVTTLRSPLGEERTVSCDFLPGFGTCESVGSKTNKDYSTDPYVEDVQRRAGMKKFDWAPKLEGGKEGLAFIPPGQLPGGGGGHDLKASDGKKHFEVTAKWQAHGIPGKPAAAGGSKWQPQNLKYISGGGKAQGVMGQKAKAWMVNNFEVHPVFGLKTEWITSIGLPKITPKIAKESHGRFASSGATSIGLQKITPKIAKERHGKFRSASSAGGIKMEIGAAGYKAAESLECLDGHVEGMDDWEAPVVRMSTSLGQVFTWGYDAQGNCTSRTAPVGGGTCIRNPFGLVTRMSVDNGPTPLVTDITYDPVTKFCSSVIQDPTGLHLTVSCDRNALGLITRLVDERGNDWLLSYNECDQLVSSSSPPVGTDALSASRISSTQFYDASGLPVRCDVEHRDATGALVTANPAYTGFCLYDVRGRLVGEASEQKPADFPLNTLIPTPSDLLSCDVCNYSLNAAGECIRVSKPAASIGQSVDLVCDYRFDERGLLFRCIQGGLGSADAVTTECSYTMYGIMKACSTITGQGGVSPTVSATFDGFRRPDSCTDEMGNVTQFSYDNKGYVTCSLYGEEVDVPGGAGNVLLARSEANHSCGRRGGALYCWGSNYMRTNPPIVTKDVDDIAGMRKQISNLKYDSFKIKMSAFFVYQETDEVCVKERFTPGQIAPHALETTTVHYSPAGLMLSEACNGDTLNTYAYDGAGRLTTCVQPGVCSTVCTLDAGGNPTAWVVTAFSTIPGAPAETFTTTSVFDPLSRQVSCSDSLSNTATCDFDSLSRNTRCVQPGGLVTVCDFDTVSASTGEFSSSCTVTQLNGLGQVLSTNSGVCLGGFCSSETDALRYTTTHACDTQGRCVLTTNPDGTTETCAYNNLGQPVSHTRKNGAIIAANFDYKERCISTTCDNLPPDVVAVPATVYVYSGLDDCVQLTQGTSVISRAYDSCGNEVSETQNGHTISCTFSQRGRNGIAYPSGERFSESRNAQGQLLSISAVNAQGQILSPPISTCDYSGFSCVREVRKNGVVTTCDYRSDGEPPVPLSGGVEDFSFGECVRCTLTSGTGTVLEDCVTRRNRDGYEVQNQRAFGVAGAGGAPRVRRMTFTLDPRNLITGCITQVRTAVGGQVTTESNVSYGLDARGQRVSASGGSHPGSYTSDATLPPGDAQMAQYSTWPGGPLSWDPNGSLTELSRGTSGLHLVYDAYSRLVEVQDAASTTLATYAYDACDRRTTSTIPSSTVGAPPAVTSYLYDGDTCIQESDGANVPQRTFACASGSAICIVPINGDPIYPHAATTSSARLRVWQLMQGENSTEAMRWTPVVPKPQEPVTYRMSVTNTTGNAMERVACDDGGQPIFLNELGNVRPGATSTISGYHWMKDCYDGACIWCPESGLIQGDGGVYSPELGQFVSKSTCSVKFKEANALSFKKGS